MDSDPGAAGHLPQGVLGQTGVGAIVLWQGVLDVELGHASLAGRVSVLDGLLCGGKHRKAQGFAGERMRALSSAGLLLSCRHVCSDPPGADDMSGPLLASWTEACRWRRKRVPGREAQE